VAQPGSAPRSHRGGQGFESPQLHQKVQVRNADRFGDPATLAVAGFFFARRLFAAGDLTPDGLREVVTLWTDDLDQVVVLIDLEVREPRLVHAAPRLRVGGCARLPSVCNQGDNRPQSLAVDVTESLVLRQLNLSAAQLPSEQALLLGGDVVRCGPAHRLLSPLEPLTLDLLHPSLQGGRPPGGLGLVARQVAGQSRLQHLKISDRGCLSLPLSRHGLLDQVRRQVALATDTVTTDSELQ